MRKAIVTTMLLVGVLSASVARYDVEVKRKGQVAFLRCTNGQTMHLMGDLHVIVGLPVSAYDSLAPNPTMPATSETGDTNLLAVYCK